MRPDELPLDQYLAYQAERLPRRTFVKFDGQQYSYRDMDRLATAFAAFLRDRGLKRGDRIAILSCNCAAPRRLRPDRGLPRGLDQSC